LLVVPRAVPEHSIGWRRRTREHISLFRLHLFILR
jgi:hypothetical protein